MLVISENSIKRRGTGIREMIATMGNFFKNNLEDVASGTCVIVTEQDDYTESKYVQENFALIFAEGQGAFTKESLRLLEQLTSNAQIVFFPKPVRDELSKSLEGERWSEAKMAITKALTKTSNLNQSIIPDLAVSAKAGEYIGILSKDEMSKNIKDFIATEIVEGIKNHCQDKIIVTQTNPQKLRSYFTDLSIQLAKLDVDDVGQFVQGIQNVLVEKCNRADLYNKIKKHIDYMIFFKKLNQDIVFPLKEWVNALADTQKYLAELGKDPEYITPSDSDSQDVLQIVGLLVGTSDIPNSSDLGNFYGRKNIKRIDLYGLNTLWLDASITSHGKEDKNGFSFCFIAPKWQITQKVTIDLSGEDGRAGNNGINGDKPGEHGSNGAPGRPGGNGGHFYGKGIDFGSAEQLRLLTINTSGGRGGNGGNGGDGADGLKGKDGDLTIKRSDPYIYNPGGAFYYQRLIQVYRYEDAGGAGSNGGNAGQGGVKGMGGGSGVAIIDRATADWYYYGDTQVRLDGTDGNPGRGGKKGEHGQDCHGVEEQENESSGIRFSLGWITPLGYQPSSKQALTDGQPATALNSDGQMNQIPQKPSLDKDKLVLDYIDICNFYAKKYQGNPFIVECDVWSK